MHSARGSHYYILEVLGLSDLAEDKLFFRSGSLDGNITEFKKSFNESVGAYGNVLYAMMMKFGNLAVKESALIVVDYATVGDDGGIESIDGERMKKGEPQTEVP